MTSDEISKLADQCMLPRHWRTGDLTYADKLQQFAYLVAERERRAVIEFVEEFLGSERGRHALFSEGFDWALDCVETLVRGRSDRDKP